MKRAIVRIAVGIAVVVCVGVVGIAGLLISGSWVSPFEKRSIRAALVEIEGVRKFRGADNEAYRAQVSKAKVAVDLCKKKEFTQYDDQMYWMIEMDFESAIAEKRAWQLPDSNPQKLRLLDTEADVDRTTEKMIREHTK
jgi:hypothetical protein